MSTLALRRSSKRASPRPLAGASRPFGNPRILSFFPVMPGLATGMPFRGAQLLGNYVFAGLDGGESGSDSTALPVNRTGPVGAPLGEPPVGSSDTA